LQLEQELLALLEGAFSSDEKTALADIVRVSLNKELRGP
jgi:hypothetical protein